MSLMDSSCTDLLLDALTLAGGTGNLYVEPHLDASNGSGPADGHRFVTPPMGRVTASHNHWFRHQPISATLAQVHRHSIPISRASAQFNEFYR
jgi:hypothetical protein